MDSTLFKLTDAKVSKCSTPERLNDGGGLYLQVTARTSMPPTGKKLTPADMVTKSWIFRYRDRGTKKLKDLGLGSYPNVSLAEARERAAKQRTLLLNGKDPKTEKVAQRAALKIENAKAITFKKAAETYISDNRSGWKNAKHADQWTNTLTTYAFPVIGAIPVGDVDLPLIRKVLDPIWTEKNETASRLRQRLEKILDWATVNGYRTGENPARWKGYLDHLLPKPSKVQDREHHAALPYDQISQFMGDLRAQKGMGALALEFTILTAARTGEAIGATWEEIDLEKRLWTVPAVRMKAGKEHEIPLSRRAVEIIQTLEVTRTGDFLFPGGKEGAPLSNMAMAQTLKRMKRLDITVHGFRSTFRDWAAEQTDYPREVIEHAISHQLKDKAEAAYHRSTMLEKRRKLMEAWAEFCVAEEPKAANLDTGKHQPDRRDPAK